MSLYKGMETPSKFSRLSGVLNVGIGVITLFYFSLGFIGYVRFGEDIEASITLMLPSSRLYNMVQLIYAVAVLCTYPLILYVPIQILWPEVKRLMFQHKPPALTDSDLSLNDDVEHARIKFRYSLKVVSANFAFRSLLVVLTCMLQDH